MLKIKTQRIIKRHYSPTHFARELRPRFCECKIEAFGRIKRKSGYMLISFFVSKKLYKKKQSHGLPYSCPNALRMGVAAKYLQKQILSSGGKSEKAGVCWLLFFNKKTLYKKNNKVTDYPALAPTILKIKVQKTKKHKLSLFFSYSCPNALRMGVATEILHSQNRSVWSHKRKTDRKKGCV